MHKKILAHIGAFFAAITVLWGLLILTSLTPNEKIRDNMLKSAINYGSLEPYSFGNGEKLNSISDNYADVILLNIVWNTDSEHPVSSSLDTEYYDGGEYGVNWGLYAAVNGEEPNTDYTRYWHGSMIFIRPLLMFTDSEGIKAVGFITAVILVLVVCVLLARRKQYFAAAAFMLSLIFVQAYNIRSSLEYIPIFIVTFAMCICFICFEKRGNELLTVLAVIGGTAAAFFDFLTCETLSLLMPLLLTVIIREQDKRLGTLKENIFLIIKCGICWGTSYVGTFIAKWAIASAVTGENKFAAALSSAEVRISGETEELSFFEQLFLAPLANISTLFGGEERVDTGRLVLGLIVTFLIAAGIYFIFRRKLTNRTVTAVCIIIGLIPYFRFMLLSNHSYLHEFFTYRAQAVSILALLTAFWFNSTMSAAPEKTKNNKKRPARKTVNVSEPEFTILMPCLNEEKTIAFCIGEAKRYITENNLSAEILIADNKSTDNSRKIAAENGARIITVSEKGYGNAVIGGIKAAKGKYIIMGDCDQSYDFYHIGDFVQKLRSGFQLVIGDRFSGGIEKGAMSFSHRYIGIPLLSLAGRLRFHTDVRDFHCGIRAFEREAALKLDLKCSGMEFATEIIAKFALSGADIAQIPVPLRRDGRNGKSHLRSIPDGWRHLKYILFYNTYH